MLSPLAVVTHTRECLDFAYIVVYDIRVISSGEPVELYESD